MSALALASAAHVCRAVGLAHDNLRYWQREAPELFISDHTVPAAGRGTVQLFGWEPAVQIGAAAELYGGGLDYRTALEIGRRYALTAGPADLRVGSAGELTNFVAAPDDHDREPPMPFATGATWLLATPQGESAVMRLMPGERFAVCDALNWLWTDAGFIAPRPARTLIAVHMNSVHATLTELRGFRAAAA